MVLKTVSRPLPSSISGPGLGGSQAGRPRSASASRSPGL